MPYYKNDTHIPHQDPPTVSDWHGHEFPPYKITMASTVDHSTHTKQVWFFDTNLICHVREIPINNGTIPGFEHVITTTPLKTFDRYKICRVNNKTFMRTVLQGTMLELKDGDTWDKFVDLYNQNIDVYNERQDAAREQLAKTRSQRVIQKQIKPTSKTEELMQELHVPVKVYMFIQKIDQPMIEREYGNKSKQTFDFIRVYASVKNMDMDEKKRILKAYKEPIMRLILKRIETDLKFQRYGIPINFLKLTQCTLTRDHQIMFLFELKDIQQD